VRIGTLLFAVPLDDRTLEAGELFLLKSFLQGKNSMLHFLPKIRNQKAGKKIVHKINFKKMAPKNQS
jgi:hypothetical protein